MVIHFCILSSAVQMYEFSHIHFHPSPLRVYYVKSRPIVKFRSLACKLTSRYQTPKNNNNRIECTHNVLAYNKLVVGTRLQGTFGKMSQCCMPRFFSKKKKKKKEKKLRVNLARRLLKIAHLKSLRPSLRYEADNFYWQSTTRLEISQNYSLL